MIKGYNGVTMVFAVASGEISRRPSASCGRQARLTTQSSKCQRDPEGHEFAKVSLQPGPIESVAEHH
jgi:hypothetical protein